MLVRVIYTSRMQGSAGRTPLSIAHILGAAAINNRRQDLCSAMLFHDGRVVQVIEGPRHAVDGLMSRLRADPRHTDIQILEDRPIPARVLTEPASVCHAPEDTLARVGLPGLTDLTVPHVEAMLDYRQAA